MDFSAGRLVLLLLTDGLPEAREASGEPLGYEALESMLAEEPATGVALRLAVRPLRQSSAADRPCARRTTGRRRCWCLASSRGRRDPQPVGSLRRAAARAGLAPDPGQDPVRRPGRRRPAAVDPRSGQGATDQRHHGAAGLRRSRARRARPVPSRQGILGGTDTQRKEEHDGRRSASPTRSKKLVSHTPPPKD